MIEHHIQITIINLLSSASSLRFTQLKPAQLESNLFVYHLKQLIAAGYVEKCDDKAYSLTNKGLTYVDSLTLTNNKPRLQPKLIAIIAIQNKQNEWLLAQRKRQPYIERYMLLSGKQHFGESTVEHIKREATEQLQIDIPLVWRGFCDIKLSNGDVLISHLAAHIYRGEYNGDPPKSNRKFRYSWHAVDANIGSIAGTSEICHRLETTTEPFHLSLDLQLD